MAPPFTVSAPRPVTPRGTLTDMNESDAVTVSRTGPVTLTGAASFYGVVYAPASPITLSGGGLFTGAFVGERLSVSNGAAVRYDETLAGW